MSRPFWWPTTMTERPSQAGPSAHDRPRRRGSSGLRGARRQVGEDPLDVVEGVGPPGVAGHLDLLDRPQIVVGLALQSPRACSRSTVTSVGHVDALAVGEVEELVDLPLDLDDVALELEVGNVGQDGLRVGMGSAPLKLAGARWGPQPTGARSVKATLRAAQILEDPAVGVERPRDRRGARPGGIGTYPTPSRTPPRDTGALAFAPAELHRAPGSAATASLDLTDGDLGHARASLSGDPALVDLEHRDSPGGESHCVKNTVQAPVGDLLHDGLEVVREHGRVQVPLVVRRGCRRRTCRRPAGAGACAAPSRPSGSCCRSGGRTGPSPRDRSPGDRRRPNPAPGPDSLPSWRRNAGRRRPLRRTARRSTWRSPPTARGGSSRLRSRRRRTTGARSRGETVPSMFRPEAIPCSE